MARVKYLKVADGRRVGIDNYPNFHCSGSIAGMKKLFYGKDSLLVRCGQYIYNVTQIVRHDRLNAEHRIYHKLAK